DVAPPPPPPPHPNRAPHSPPRPTQEGGVRPAGLGQVRPPAPRPTGQPGHLANGVRGAEPAGDDVLGRAHQDQALPVLLTPDHNHPGAELVPPLSPRPPHASASPPSH